MAWQCVAGVEPPSLGRTWRQDRMDRQAGCIAALPSLPLATPSAYHAWSLLSMSLSSLYSSSPPPISRYSHSKQQWQAHVPYPFQMENYVWWCWLLPHPTAPPFLPTPSSPAPCPYHHLSLPPPYPLHALWPSFSFLRLGRTGHAPHTISSSGQ